MIFYLRNVVKYYSEVGDTETIITRCLKANRKNCMFIIKLKMFETYIKFYFWSSN